MRKYFWLVLCLWLPVGASAEGFIVKPMVFTPAMNRCLSCSSTSNLLE